MAKDGIRAASRISRFKQVVVNITMELWHNIIAMRVFEVVTVTVVGKSLTK